MKKIVTYLALAAFAIASHMTSVHAWDMFGMEMVHSHAEESGRSIFCNDAPSQNAESDCAKQAVPEKTVVTSRSFELPEPKTAPEPFVAFVEKSTSDTIESAAYLATPPPRRERMITDGGDGYVARIGDDVRKLD